MFTRRVLQGATFRTPDLPPPVTTAEYSGAVPLGTANYAIPSSNVIYLATNGNNANDGTSPSAAKATLQAAITAVPAGGTVVVRGGVYNQAYSGDMTKTITLQNYPGEVVWFDGTTQVTSWTSAGNNTWYCATLGTFDHGADYSGTGDPTRWIDSQTRERAFWPEMVFINDVEQMHVEGTPGAGQFRVDYDTNRVYIGTNPSGKTVRVTNYGRLIVVKAPNCQLRGFGVRRYASSMVSNGAITAVTASAGSIQENIHFTEFPIQANSFTGNGSIIRNCTFTNIGMMATSGNRGDGLSYNNNYLENINTRMFKGPTPAGVKLARWTNGMVANNYVKNVARAYGIWLDVYHDKCVMLNNYVENCGGGVFYEISWRGLMVNNRVVNTTNGSNTASLWFCVARESEMWLNQTDRGSAYDIWVSGDSRHGDVVPEQPSDIGDLRAADAIVCNNVLANTLPINGVWRVMVENVSIAENTTPYVSRFAGNVISSTTSSSGTTSISRYLTFERADGEVISATTNAAAITNWGSTKIGANYFTSTQIPTTNNVITPSVISANAEPLPARIAAMVGLPAGTKAIGPVLPAPIARVPSY